MLFSATLNASVEDLAALALVRHPGFECQDVLGFDRNLERPDAILSTFVG